MAEYIQMTPEPRARGRYTVRQPFTIKTDVDYTCIGIRSFSDLYREKIDPYEAIYRPAGLIEGQTYDGQLFRFGEEAARGINIITLADDLGNHLLIPDNYITAMPTSTTTSYLEFVMSVSLGPLPSDMDVSVVEEAIRDAVGEQFGIEPKVMTHTLPTTTSPTYEESLALEAARQGRVKIGSSKDAQILTLTKINNEQDLKIKAMIKILQDNNLMP